MKSINQSRSGLSKSAFSHCALRLLALTLLPAADALAIDDSEATTIANVGLSLAGKTITLMRATSAPVLDGQLDDALWEQATVVEELVQSTPNEGATPGERTVVRVLYDANSLYIGARLYDRQADRITANLLTQGSGLGPEDRFEVQIDPFFDRRSGYSFEVNPNGVRSQGIYQNFNNLNRNWQGIWYAVTSRDSEGWSVEIEIPFKSISFNPNTTRWGINFARMIQRTNEQSSWTSYNRSYAPPTFGIAEGLSDLQQGLGLDIKPILKVVNDQHYVNDTQSTTFEPSLNVFYRFAPAVTGALTVNTDFSATEADARTVQLTRFSPFLPEKRDFFLQDADIFEFGSLDNNGRPFFSRRLGLDTNGTPLDINVGVKLTGRIDRWNLGFFEVNQDRGDGSGSTDLQVARLTANLGDKSTVGMIATYGNPFGPERNSVVGVDYRYSDNTILPGQTLKASAWYQLADSELYAHGERAYGASISLPNAARWNSSIAFAELGENFSPALGFVNRKGIQKVDTSIGYTHLPASGAVRSIATKLNASSTRNLAGELESQFINLQLVELATSNNDRIKLELKDSRENTASVFRLPFGFNVPADRYHFQNIGLNLNSAERRKFSANASLESGGFYDGSHRSAVLGMVWHPSPYFGATVSYNHNAVTLPSGTFTTRLYSLNTTAAFNADWAWFNLMQYDNASSLFGINSRVRWIPQPGSEAYLVLNYGAFDDPLLGWQKQMLTAAISAGYTFRF